METSPGDETSLKRKLISDALFGLANEIDIHATKESVSFDQLIASQDLNDTHAGGQQMSQRHMWFSTHGGYGSQIYPYGQTLLHMAVTELGLDRNKYEEYFHGGGNEDNYSINIYLERVKEKTSELRRFAAQLISMK